MALSCKLKDATSPWRVCLHSDSRYVVLPMSFNQFGIAADRPTFKCDFHSSEPLLIEAVNCPPELIAAAVMQHVISMGTVHRPFADDRRDKMRVFVDDLNFVAENRSRTRTFEVALQFEPTRHFTSTRVVMSCKDIVPPGHRQLLCAISAAHSNVVGALQYVLPLCTFDADIYCDRVSYHTLMWLASMLFLACFVPKDCCQEHVVFVFGHVVEHAYVFTRVIYTQLILSSSNRH